jgi:UDP-N-acetylmuramate: L-alanyl-gamma-D-glutamyl-meso-diaminopimelate ligase
MLAWIFEVAGLKPSFLVGGIAENFGSSFADTNGRYFIVEGDEYDSAFFDKGPKFLHYFPDGLILTSIEFDHADIYKDLDAVKTAFKRLVNLVPRRGVIVAHDADANVTECLAPAFCQVQRYGFQSDSFWRVEEVKTESGTTTWNLLRKNELWVKLSFALAGEFNVLNATAAAALARHYGVRPEQVREALATFKSVKRRMEVRGVFEGVTIIDDFAHHPTAIMQTLKALRTRYPQSRLWAICEPRSNTLRRKVFEKELAESLAIADEVILATVFRSEAIPEGERLSPEAVIQRLRQQGRPARLLPDADVIAETVAPELSSGDVVAILSNGGFGNIYEKLPQRLKARHEVQVRK